ncbi:hypothetical protein GCM10009795_021930 [Nocardioides hankookensis]
MVTGIDEWIRVEVEQSFASEPPLRDPQEYVAHGRRVRRRRRIAAAATGLVAAAVATVAVGGAQLGSAGPDQGLRPAAPTIDAVKVTTPVPIDPTTKVKCRADALGPCGRPGIGWDDIHLDSSGQVVRGYPDVRVTGYYDHVFGDAYGVSAALEVSDGTDTAWLLLTASKDLSESGFESDAPDPDRTFDEWVHDSLTLGGAWFSYAREPMIPAGTPR